MMKLIQIVSVFVVLLLLAMPVLAQDALPVDVGESPVAMLSIAVVVLGVACIILMGMVVMLLNRLGANLEAVRDMIPAGFLQEINDTIDQRVNSMVYSSKTPIDDMVWGVVSPLLTKAVSTIVGDEQQPHPPIPPKPTA
jgi:hypothetical protein